VTPEDKRRMAQGMAISKLINGKVIMHPNDLPRAKEAGLVKNGNPDYDAMLEALRGPGICACAGLMALIGLPVMCDACDAKMAEQMRNNGGSYGPGV
jgi:hypothetical protein